MASVMQGDAYNIPVTIKSGNGTLITPEIAACVEITVGQFTKRWPGQVTFDEKTGEWKFPVTQNQTFRFAPGAAVVQARVVFQDGSIMGGSGAPVRVEQSASRGTLPQPERTEAEPGSAPMATEVTIPTVHDINVSLHSQVILSDPIKAPYIGENGNWYEYDAATGTFVDTGIKASAQKSAEEAAKSAAEAKAAQMAAAEAANAAEISKTAAEQSAVNALESKTAAEGAATTAENAKTIAVDAKDKALTAERNAKDSETNAVNAAKSAAQSANDANVEANIAVSASNSAKASEDAANESRIAAESAKDASVQNAKQSADSAVAAKLSEDNAKQSETGAKSAQSTAEQNAKDAVNAKTAAENAQKGAQESASNAAQSAKDAKTANEFAQGAQAKAEAAEQESVKKAQEAAQSAAEARESADRAEQAADRASTLIDDTAIFRDKTWSSKNIVDMVCPAIEETGNPVVCTPVPNYPLGVKASWTPIQEGSGEPSPDNIRPIKGRDSVTVERREDSMTRTLTLPSALYGGEVDAVTGEGILKQDITTFAGNDKFLKYESGNLKFFYTTKLGVQSKQGRQLCSHFGRVEIVSSDIVRFYAVDLFDTIESFTNYIVAQYAAGTPVQVAYKVVEPTPFTATGNAPIPAMDGTNTILTDADTVTVVGRETPQSYIDRKLKETNTAIAAL